jgi:hypothetical protein
VEKHYVRRQNVAKSSGQLPNNLAIILMTVLGSEAHVGALGLEQDGDLTAKISNSIVTLNVAS